MKIIKNIVCSILGLVALPLILLYVVHIVLIGGLVGMIGSSSAVRKYLKV